MNPAHAGFASRHVISSDFICILFRSSGFGSPPSPLLFPFEFLEHPSRGKPPKRSRCLRISRGDLLCHFSAVASENFEGTLIISGTMVTGVLRVKRVLFENGVEWEIIVSRS